MKCVTLKITGKVQGVFFRASTKERADLLGIKGFVRNERDGGVYIEAEGETEILDQFIEWCKKGPSRAAVMDVKISEAEPRRFSSFTVTR